METKCIFCESKINVHVDNRDIYHCTCYNCGFYKITCEAFEDLPSLLIGDYSDSKYLISGYLREMAELKLPSELITNDNYKELFNNSKIPTNAGEKLDKLLSHIFRRTEFLYQEIIINTIEQQSAIGYAKNMRELENMLKALAEKGFLKEIGARGLGNKDCILTVEGFNRCEKLQKEYTESKQGFVAMWFADSMLDTYNKYISKAIQDAGYAPFIISMKEHNEDICDNIIAEIRKSKFLVADFTGQRGGAYFEAGFAYGLGLPVIWTCRDDWFNKVVEVEVDVKIDGKIQKGIINQEHFTHFDINHYNFIVWKDGDDLYEKLKNRILATIPNKQLNNV